MWKLLSAIFKYCTDKYVSLVRVSFCFPGTLDCKHTSSYFPQGALFRCSLSYIMVIMFILCINNYIECLLFSKVLYFFDVFLAIMNCCAVTVYFMLTTQVTCSLVFFLSSITCASV